MNNDYLWDKSGEPDPEIEELEQILGALRYQPRALVLPEDVVVPRRRSYYPLLAIAATIAVALLATGLWFSLKSTNTPESKTARKTVVAPTPAPSVEPNKIVEQRITNNEPTPTQHPKPRRHTNANRALIAKKQREREEALAAKEQLLLALRLASEKLNQAQRKTQHPAVPNQIRNQHKVG